MRSYQCIAVRAFAQTLCGRHNLMGASAASTGRAMAPPWDRHGSSSRLIFGIPIVPDKLL